MVRVRSQTRVGISLSLAVILAGCVSYQPPAEMTADESAGLRFVLREVERSQYALTGQLRVRIYHYENDCPSPVRIIGPLNPTYMGDVYLSDREREAEIRVPASGWIFFETDRTQGFLGFNRSCFLVAGWVPTATHEYELTYAYRGKQCSLGLQDLTLVERVPLAIPGACHPTSSPH